MKKTGYIASLLVASLLCLASNTLRAAEMVTVDNFVRAETDQTLKRYVAQGGFGKIVHIRQPVPIDKQEMTRMNRDTLYSFGVFDLTNPVRIIKPNPAGRFQSMLIINQDHSMQPVEHGSGEFTLTLEKIGTRYMIVIFRTFMDASNPEDIQSANALQDQIKAMQDNAGSFEIPDWAQASLRTMRVVINVLAATKASVAFMFGDKAKLNPIDHLLGTAFEWGGIPEEAGMYVNRVPAQNDGKKLYLLTAKDVPVDGFWSVTVYNAKGFMEKNSRDAYSVNSITALKNEDGSITVHFGGDPANPNYLPITKGWNYLVRLYQPRKELLDGTWVFPDATPVQ